VFTYYFFVLSATLNLGVIVHGMSMGKSASSIWPSCAVTASDLSHISVH